MMWQILEYHPQMLKEYLSGTDQANFMYPRYSTMTFVLLTVNVFAKVLEVSNFLIKCVLPFMTVLLTNSRGSLPILRSIMARGVIIIVLLSGNMLLCQGENFLYSSSSFFLRKFFDKQ
jgi:hypothetical protein